MEMKELNSNLMREFDEIRYELENSREMNQELARENEKLSMKMKEIILNECKEIIQRQVEKIMI